MLKLNKIGQTTRTVALLGAAAAALLGVAAGSAQAAGGAKVKYIHDFPGSYGVNAPGGALVQGRNGNIYGELNFNAAKIFQGGTVIWDSQANGEATDTCYNGMTLGTDGLLYGTCVTWNYNESVSGIIFQYTPGKKQNGFKIIYTWPAFGEEGSENPSPLTLGPGGNFYGTTHGDDTNPYGTVFMVTPQGVYTTLHVFQGWMQNDGAYPSQGSAAAPENSAPLTLGSDGNFYGTTDEGGMNGDNSGTIYQITPSGTVTILHDFVEGSGGATGVVELNGNFYGQTILGGTHDQGTIYELASDGTFTTLHNFHSTTDKAAAPAFPFVIGSDGNLYNAASDYHSGGFGPESLYEITPSGTYTDLYDKFGNPQSGCYPSPVKNGCQENSPLLLTTNGVFYGVTQKGPDDNEGGGTVFTANINQTPFVRPILPVATPGEWLGILGQGFSRATKVSFNGTPAAFRVVSDTYLEARVPSDAGKGRISVTTKDGELHSNADFSPLH